MDKGTDYVALACLYGGYYAMLLIMCIFILPVLPFLWALKGKWYNPWGIAEECFWYNLTAKKKSLEERRGSKWQK